MAPASIRSAEPAPAPKSAPTTGPARLYFLDNLRVLLIMLVIAHHVGQAYGPTGGAWPISEPTRAGILGAMFVINRSFFMSLFFMIAGYFTVGSYDAHGLAAFVKGRLLRLGIPTLVWMLFMVVMQALVFKGPLWPLDAGHLWFLEHLLIFSLVYALYRVIADRRKRPARALAPTPGVLAVLGFALVIALLLLVVRHWYPIDRWVTLLGFIKVMWADVPRDLAFFIIGLVAYRNDWIMRFPKRAGLAWLAVGLALSFVWVLVDLQILRPWNYTGIAWDVLRVVWEALFACAISIGLTVLFREVGNFGGRLARELGKAQYAAYIFHILIVLGVQYAVVSLPVSPLAKFAIVTPISIVLTFAFSVWVRRPLRL